jgi:hypothetical protein
MRGGHDGGVFGGGEFGLGRAVAWQQYRVWSQQITHPRHGPHCAVRCGAVDRASVEACSQADG